ncbi:hypothetical protein Bhyg_06552 [Pseudolycoriella hygida]|uniref:Uncharacterized protein n=1 Tax=Pseudolycoriella hygida TaxID=35572 RepID=A0A9Q0N241_9DIPT|nr:hypothetical protein Bhyg_06552 [Pseudolycoriella hygida]
MSLVLMLKQPNFKERKKSNFCKDYLETLLKIFLVDLDSSHKKTLQMAHTRVQIRFKNDSLARAWLAGVYPEQFRRTASVQQIQMCSVPQFDDAKRRVEAASKKTEKAQSLKTFSYIFAGITQIFRLQVAMLYDEILRSSQLLGLALKPTSVQSVLKRRTSDETSIEHSRKCKQRRMSVDKIDWKSFESIEIDIESTFQILRNDYVMNNDEISIAEVIESSEEEANDSDYFDAVDNVTTEYFLQIQELVAQGRSLLHLIEHEESGFSVTRESGLLDEERYAPIMEQECTSLSNIDRCMSESDDDIPCDDDPPDEGESGLLDEEAPIMQQECTSLSNIDRYMNESDDDIPCDDPSNKGESGLLDEECYAPIMQQEYTSLIDRYMNESDDDIPCDDGPSDIASVHVDETVSSLTLSSVQDFRNEVSSLAAAPVASSSPYIQPHHSRLTMKKRNRNGQPQEETSVQYGETSTSPQPCNERQVTFGGTIENGFGEMIPDEQDEPFCNEDDGITFMETYNDDEGVYAEILPTDSNLSISCNGDKDTIGEEVDVPNLPSVNNSQTVEPQCNYVSNDPIVDPQPMGKCIRPDSATVPRNVMQLLRKFITVQEETSHGGSQIGTLLKATENRKKFGMQGVLEKLFVLWNSGSHPIGMKDLMNPCKDKVAAASAFYAILELNSPRINLIQIEKCENSNQ